MSINKTSYLRFLNLIDALDRMNPGKKLDCTEESLLDKIILSFHAKQSVLVGDLISLSSLGSQATLHGRLKNLSAMGYIKMAANVDGRKKEVVPTKLALKRYDEISKCLEKAAKAGWSINLCALACNKKALSSELTPKSWTLYPTKGVLFYEQVQQAVQAKGSSRVFKVRWS